MKIQILACVLLVAGLLGGCAQSSRGEDKNEAQKQVDGIAALLTNHDIGTVEIFHIPPHVESPISISSEMIEKHFEYRFTIRSIELGEYEEELAKVMKSVKVSPGPESVDIRWGIVFYHTDGRRLLGIYLDGEGESGLVGHTHVSFNRNLFNWLNRKFSKCFP